MLRTIAALLVAMLAVPVPVLAQTQPAAYYSFDKDMNGAGPGGAIVSALVGKPELVAGRVGQGPKVGPTYGALDCPAAGVVNRTAGTGR